MVLCLKHNVAEGGPRADHHDWHPGHVGSTPHGHCACTGNTLANAGNLGPPFASTGTWCYLINLCHPQFPRL